MPDPREHLDAGLNCEKGGVLDRAAEHYRAAATANGSPAITAEAWRRLASVLRTRCEWDSALEAARRSAEVARAAGDDDLFAEALIAEAAVYQSRGQFDAAVPLLERSLTTTEDDRIRGIALQNLGNIAAVQGDLETAEQRFLESHGCFQRAGYTWGEAFAFNNSGRAALERGRLDTAAQLLEQAVDKAKQVNDLDLLALARLNYAETLAARNDLNQAQDLASAALGYFATAGNTWRRVECLRLLGTIYSRQGSRATAIRCYEQGLRLAESIGARVETEELAAALAEMRATPEPQP